MQFRLRTLLIVLALGPIVLAVAWAICQEIVNTPQRLLQHNYQTVSPLP
jgi:hypothetical protein